MLTPSHKIYTAPSKVVPGERGVFAKKIIIQGEVIEICPILRISLQDTEHIHEESLVTYMFYFGKEKQESLIALGYGSLYNHSKNPNAEYIIKPDENVITFTAVTTIKKDEEITVQYAAENNKKLWFEK